MEKYQNSMTEAQMLKALKDYTGAEGGFFFHVRDARGLDVEGMPDCVILIPRSPRRMGVCAFFELKTQYDKVTSRQRHIIQAAGQIDETVGAIIRPNPKGILEVTLDDALALLGHEDWQ